MGSGTLRWMAPELLEGDPLQRPCDVYSFGLVAWELYSGCVPYGEIPERALVRKIVDQQERPSRPDSMKDLVWNVTGTCWVHEPGSRPTFDMLQSSLKPLLNHTAFVLPLHSNVLSIGSAVSLTSDRSLTEVNSLVEPYKLPTPHIHADAMTDSPTQQLQLSPSPSVFSWLDASIPGRSLGLLLFVGECSHAMTIGLAGVLPEPRPRLAVQSTAQFTIGSPVLTVVLSPDNEQIYIGCMDGSIRILRKGLLHDWYRPSSQQSSAVRSLAMSNDGMVIAFGTESSTIQIRNAATGQVIGPTLYYSRCVAFFPEGQHIVFGSSDKSVRIWDTSTGQQLGDPLVGPTKDVTCIAVSPNGKYIACGSNDTAVYLWDAVTRELVGKLSKEPGLSYVASVAFSPDSTRIASGSCELIEPLSRRPLYKYPIQIWQTATGQAVGQPLMCHWGIVLSVAYSPNGKHIVSCAMDQTVRIWDVATGRQVGPPLYGHTNGPDSVAVSSNGERIVSGGYDGTVQVWDAKALWDAKLKA